MLCLASWCGVSDSKQKSKDESNDFQVFSKLGGTLIGTVRRPCLDDAFLVLRNIQDQTAKLIPHRDQASPRYLALFVGQKRLTGAEFPFIDQLDVGEGQQVLATLSDALRIDVLWDEDESCAKRRLRQMGYAVKSPVHRGRDGTASRSLHVNARNVTKSNPLELEAFGLLVPKVTSIYTTQTRLCGINKFRDLHTLVGEAPLQEVDFVALARIETLRGLSLRLALPLDANIASMRNLRTLCVEVLVDSRIPVELSELKRLEELGLHGKFVGNIPFELCKLSRLAELDLSNTNLEGTFPKGFSKLRLLRKVRLERTEIDSGWLNGWHGRLAGWKRCMKRDGVGFVWMLFD
jgi:hypothetical protein